MRKLPEVPDHSILVSRESTCYLFGLHVKFVSIVSSRKCSQALQNAFSRTTVFYKLILTFILYDCVKTILNILRPM